MRKSLLILISIFLVHYFTTPVACAQSTSSIGSNKISPGLRLLLKKSEKQIIQYKNTFDIITTDGIVTFNVLIKLAHNRAIPNLPGVFIYPIIGDIASARASRAGIAALSKSPDIVWVEASKFLRPNLDISRISTTVDKVYNGNPSYRGKGVIVGVFDSGIDWRHEDFIDDQGRSRILYLWDMTDDAGPHPAGFDYGSEYTQDQINDEIDASPTGLVREKDTNGHGTHVAGIAAGDGSATGNGQPDYQYIGMAPLADLIVVKGGDGSFSTINQVNGIAYIMKKGDELGRPVSMNMSVGGHWGAHDGTALHEQAIDAALAKEGRAIVISASNDGEDPIHASGYAPAGGSISTNFSVQENSNDVWIDLWHDGSEQMSLTVTTPDGYTTTPISSGSLDDWQQWDTNSGRIELVAPSQNPNNGDFEITIYLDDEGDTPVQAGDWYFTLYGENVNHGRFDAWTQAWKVEFTSNVDPTMLVGMPGTARNSITVASYCTKNEWTALDGKRYSYNSDPTLWDISSFSSRGPTRDGREKPEITAPGHGISSTLSRDSEPSDSRIMQDGVHKLLQGTSMSAPHVTGAIALLFEKDPTLTHTQIREILTRTAYVDNYTGYVWNNAWGYGKLEIKPALELIDGNISGTFAQHDIGAVNCGISDWGALGEAGGGDPGFRFPSNSDQDHGYAGTFVAGVWGKDVADSYGTGEHREDDLWRTTSNGRLRVTEPGHLADQEGFAQFDKLVLTPDGLTRLQVDQISYAWRSSPNNAFILLDYEVTNLGPYDMKNLILGFYMDWDCQPNYETNYAQFDRDLNLAYMWDGGSDGNPYLGTMLLGQTPNSFNAINNAASVYNTNDLPDDVMFQLMHTPGIMGGLGPGDLSTLLAAAPVALQKENSTRFTIALVAGNSLAELRQNAIHARDKFNHINSGVTLLYYDDGTAEGSVLLTDPGERLAVQFTPESYPATLSFANFYIRDAGAAIKLDVFNDSGTGGTPGTSLLNAPITVTPQSNSWNSVDLSNRNCKINHGNFFISLEWTQGNAPSIGYDEEFPYARRSWYFDGSFWSNFTEDGDPWDKRDVMIGVGLRELTAVGTKNNQKFPAGFSLSQNFPNPFNSETRFYYSVAKPTMTEIAIYNVLGQKIRELVHQSLQPGNYSVRWDGQDDDGQYVSSGIYFCLFQTKEFNEKRKLLLIQ